MGGYLSTLSGFWTQSFFIAEPPLTEKNLPDQTGKVHIVTGGYAGVGHELVKILYQKNAKVYVAGRSKDKADKSIATIRNEVPNSKGELVFLLLDLNDLSKIEKSAQDFLDKEERLDVLTNNAGVMFPPSGSKNAHGHEVQIGTNILGPYLFTKYLTPILKKTAASSPPNTVRVTWPGSLAVLLLSPQGGVQFEEDGNVKIFGSKEVNYGTSKTANLYLASEFGKRYSRDGVVSVCYNPGNLNTELARHINAIQAMATKLLCYPAIYGAYTELYSGWSPNITADQSGMFVVPWGRDATAELRPDVLKGLKSEQEMGSGVAAKLWEWCESETSKYS